MNFIISTFLSVAVIFLPVISQAAETGEWEEYRARHFIIYYKEAPLDYIQEIEEAAEDYYVSVTKSLSYTRYKTWSFDERVAIYVYDNQDDYVDKGSQKSWSHGAASPSEKIIRTFPTAHGFFDSTLPHELAHIIFREMVGYRIEVPAWFEEGIAMYQERGRRFGAHDAVRQAMKEGRFIPLTELSLLTALRKNDKEKILLFYAEAASIVNFMISKYGKTKFNRFLRKLKSSQSFDMSLSDVYVRARTVKKLSKEWEKFLNGR